MKTTVVLLNGPPLSGKDSGADHLVDFFRPCGAVKREFKQKLFDLVMLIYSIKPERFWQIYNDRALKEKPLPEFEGLSIRQAMIKVSEEVIKPNYGKQYFGVAAARELQEGVLNIFSDSGFVEEIEPIVEKVGAENIFLIRVYKEGCKFLGDSRNYLPPECLPFVLDLYNDSTLERYKEWLEFVVKDFLLNRNNFAKTIMTAHCSQNVAFKGFAYK